MKSSEIKIFHLLTSLETIPQGWLFVMAIVIVILLGVVDYLTGFELSFSFFYLMPVTMVAWTLGRKIGLLFSVLGATVWFTSNLLSGQSISNPFIGVWNTLIRFGFYAVVTILLTELHLALEEEHILATTDPLTGALNRRSFNEIVEKKMIATGVSQHPHTMVYIDLDNFKGINDQLGHSVGDLALRAIVDTIQAHIRSADFLARLGGDEFAILLTDIDQQHAKIIVERLQSFLCEKMRTNHWNVTFSIGVLTVLNTPESVDKLIGMTDALMYEVKATGKDAIHYSVYKE